MIMFQQKAVSTLLDAALFCLVGKVFIYNLDSGPILHLMKAMMHVKRDIASVLRHAFNVKVIFILFF
jgi:hypothetical protein